MVVLVSSTSTNGAVIRRVVMLAAPILINRSMTNYCAGVSKKWNRINPRWRPNKERNGHLSPRSRTNIYHLPASWPPLFLIGHYLEGENTLKKFNLLEIYVTFLHILRIFSFLKAVCVYTLIWRKISKTISKGCQQTVLQLNYWWEVL
jgi:hypothetical protein